jgi:UDP-N-acetylmuramoyl-tripeptide--D-alanyl-D-alanine ligase
MLKLSQAMAWLPGATLVGDGATSVLRVHSDTRTLQPGDLFVALKGERYDANAFLAQAHAQGAVAALAHRGALPAGMPGIEVGDTRAALGLLASGWRAQFKLPVVAVTGSNGKTTVTQMIASILRAWCGDASLATQGNLNNDIGVPLTLLRMRSTHQVAVIELGMNHPGEIEGLARMTQPTVALVNNAQREHQEFMATVAAVARENGTAISALGTSGTAVFPAGDAFTALWQGLADQRSILTFAEGTVPADVQGTGVWRQGAWQVTARTPAGTLAFDLHIAGRHNVRNALAASACALAAGAPLEAIAQGLEAFLPVKGRSRAFSVTVQQKDITVVDDTYNANPDSARAAVDVLAELPGPRLLVLGDMGEVGDRGPAFHAEIGGYARTRGIETLFTLGEQAIAMQGRHFESMESLNTAVLAQLPAVASVLVKGSRFMKMERVIEAISSRTAPNTTDLGAEHAA